MHRTQTQASYQERVSRVTDYLHAHIEDEVSFEQLAEIACLSPYHWSRIYNAMQGETITTTIRRLRLQRAADRLASSDMAIAAVAQRAGYGSADTFGRAFRQSYGMSPAAYRERGSHAAFRAACAADDATGFDVAVIDRPQQRCASVGHTGSYMQIDHAMGRLFAALAARQSVPVQPAMIGVFFDDPDLGSEEKLRSRACLPVGPDVALAAPLVETVLRGGLYARLHYKGPYADMRAAYRWLLGVWLPASGHEPDDAPIFEAYLNDPRAVPPTELRTDIHLPLRPQA